MNLVFSYESNLINSGQLSITYSDTPPSARSTTKPTAEFARIVIESQAENAHGQDEEQ